MKLVLTDFSKLLDNRLRQGIHTTEDSIRYMFFHAMTKNGANPIEIILEYPFENKKIDLYAPEQNLCAEFKYHRRPVNPNTKTPKTANAGKVVADLIRLAIFKQEEKLKRLLVYVYTDEMKNYFSNKHPALLSERFQLSDCIEPATQDDFHKQIEEYKPYPPASISTRHIPLEASHKHHLKHHLTIFCINETLSQEANDPQHN